MSDAWFKFFPSDWANDPKLKLCSMAAQGFWMRLICVASESDPKGYVAVGKTGLTDDEIAVVTGYPLQDVKIWLADLEKRDVFSRTAKGTIFSRKMVRDAKKAKKCSDSGKKGMSSRYSQPNENNNEFSGPYNNRNNGNLTPEARSQKPEIEAVREIEANLKDSGGLKDSAEPAKPARPINPSPSEKPKLPKVEAKFFHEVFWPAYPRKIEKKAAEKAWLKAIKAAPPQRIMAGLEAYKLNKPDYADWAHPTSWLNGERWNDEYLPGGQQPKRADNIRPFPKSPRDAELERKADFRNFFNDFLGGEAPQSGEPPIKDITPKLMLEN